jgi:phenylalanyl-tRNA synthetase beta chain
MRVSMKWLSELVEVDLAPTELAEKLDMTGTAVEAIHTAGEALDGVVVGQITEKDKHPDADKLWVTKVDVGKDEPLTIVCGAQNFEAGDKTPVALVGTELPGGFKIKKAKLRGVVSKGMNCSAAELGLGTDADGIMILPEDAPIGAPFAEYHGMADAVLELEVTPNRPDCLSMAGIAREVGAVTGKDASVPASQPAESGEPIADSVAVTIEDTDSCPRYTARLIRRVTIGPSPEWLAEKITACGQRPVNNIVDITNYVMFELGQPLHAFDASTIAQDEDGRSAIIVRRAQEGERLTTLDGQDRTLTERMLLICDPSGPIALAGVMGGAETEVSEQTVDIILESAAFDADRTSHTSRSLGLISEASMRFERGVDPNGCVAAVDRAADLMAELCGGTVAPGVVDVYPDVAESLKLELRIDKLNAVLGTEIESAEATRILEALGFATEGDDVLSVSVPTYRPDVTREIDLIEEVVRVWGMGRVEATLPGGRERVGRLTEDQVWHERIGATMRAAGLNETMTYSFVDPADLDSMRYELGEGEVVVELLNPMSEEQAVMRRTLLPGLLRSVSYNQRRGVSDIHLYEMGNTFVTAKGSKLPKEILVLGGVLAGEWNAPAWNDPVVSPKMPGAALRSTALDFFDGKGVLEALQVDMGIKRFKLEAAEIPWLQPGRSAKVLVGGQPAGWIGEVHPAVLEALDTNAPVVAFEIEVDHLVRAAVAVKSYEEVPRYPAVEFDIALVVDHDITAERVEQSIRSAGGTMLDSVRLFDVYEGDKVGEGKKSLAYSLEYRASDRTLSDDEVRPVHEKLVRKVCGALGAELRG